MEKPVELPRCLFVVPCYPYPVVGGLEWQAHQLAKTLVKIGVKVTVMSTKFVPQQSKFELVEGVPVHRIRWVSNKTFRFLITPFAILWFLYRTRRYYDVIHLHQHSWFGLFTIIASRIFSKPILTKLPNVGSLGISGMLTQYCGQLRRRILICSDAIVAMSKDSVRELIYIKFPLSRVVGVPNGVIIDSEFVGYERNSSGTSIPIKCVFVGRLSEEKRVITLLRAWTVVQARHGPRATLQIWGEGPLEKELKQNCRDLGLCDTVIFNGFVPSVKQHLPHMDVFVLPSIAEGNPNACLEAMVAGLPIVATKVGGIPMLVGPEGVQLLFEIDDAEGLAERLCMLIERAEIRSKLGMLMRERAKSFFDMNMIAKIYVKVYKHLTTHQRDQVYLESHPLLSVGTGEGSD